jgi:hypothetical protein
MSNLVMQILFVIMTSCPFWAGAVAYILWKRCNEDDVLWKTQRYWAAVAFGFLAIQTALGSLILLAGTSLSSFFGTWTWLVAGPGAAWWALGWCGFWIAVAVKGKVSWGERIGFAWLFTAGLFILLILILLIAAGVTALGQPPVRPLG